MHEPAAHQRLLAIHARTSFSFAARFLPVEKRHATTTLYGFFRTLDDVVDNGAPHGRHATARSELRAWRDWLQDGLHGPGPREPLAQDLARVIAAHGVPVRVVTQLLDGLESDLERDHIEHELELRRYCYQVASTVGIAMAHVLGVADPPALAAAATLGAAMQLTNILRDVGEDLDLGRIYLPRTTLASYGLSAANLHAMRVSNRGPDERFRALMRAQIAHADALYDDGLAGVSRLPRDCRLPILVAGRLYRRLLRLIERAHYDTLRRRVATSRRDKVFEATTCFALIVTGRLSAPRVPAEQRVAAVMRTMEDTMYVCSAPALGEASAHEVVSS